MAKLTEIEMAAVNKVILVGYLGSTPDIRFMPNGDKVATCSLGTTRKWKDKNTQERKEKTQWHRLVFYKGLVEVAENYLDRGSQIYAEGELRYRKFEKDGVTHFSTEIAVQILNLLDRKKDDHDDQYCDIPDDDSTTV